MSLYFWIISPFRFDAEIEQNLFFDYFPNGCTEKGCNQGEVSCTGNNFTSCQSNFTCSSPNPRGEFMVCGTCWDLDCSMVVCSEVKCGDTANSSFTCDINRCDDFTGRCSNTTWNACPFIPR